MVSGNFPSVFECFAAHHSLGLKNHTLSRSSDYEVLNLLRNLHPLSA